MAAPRPNSESGVRKETKYVGKLEHITILQAQKLTINYSKGTVMKRWTDESQKHLRDYFLDCTCGLKKLRESKTNRFHHCKIVSLILESKPQQRAIHIQTLFKIVLAKSTQFELRSLPDANIESIPPCSWQEQGLFPVQEVFLLQPRWLDINSQECRDTSPVHREGSVVAEMVSWYNSTCTYCEFGGWARQEGE